MKIYHRVLGWLTLITLLLLCSTGFWLCVQRQQYAHNCQLIDALKRKDTTTALALINAGADPNTPCFPASLPSLKLLCAYLLYHTPTPANTSPTAFMIACAADCGSWGGSQVSPSVEENPVLLQTMLAHGANTNLRAWNNLTPLHSAVIKQRLYTVELLLKHGADINAQDEAGCTPLMLTASNADLNIARLLLSHGANPNVQDVYGDTALYWAMQSPNVRIIFHELLANGADPKIKNNYGNTPLMLAQKRYRSDFVTLLQ